ncbi:MAG TPA: alcohol dehydrogenase catalytic domain-containing protein [Bosea sp. (in: a-proteobacteria)]|jgi:threonine dehydrogenase-like Zn-dependent dehydrogenase|uniref:zinc-dependent alcohol dehydrogenase n=1 Tax=Bosea sp. (in: a-proteobacteria) TaxID=1871050 RepID=UPI002DDCE6A8|nr:alcohol dehydrogenase catalytic domain-containing protein [Bosea sp. (in: a-proteobacteria)]HEV2554177.1 alcohol dehydrogenase catalytic domain-containing protein [Bosea sp. (in: a-proteobacteria)]
MKALVYTGPNSLVFRDEPDPVPLADEVLVCVEAVGICGSDMHAYHGFDARRPPPLILGHEAAGRIATGPRAGERVTINPLVVDPACPYAIEGRWHLSPTRQIISMPPRPGAFAELVRIPQRNLMPIPDAMPIAHAALAEPVAVSWHAVRIGMQRLHQPLAACRVVVLGGGAIGLAAALVARLFGARDLVIGETNPQRRATVEAEGIAVYRPGEDEPDDNSADLVIDAVGADATRAAACRMTRPGGVIVHVGLLPEQGGLDIRKLTLQEITLAGVYCYTPTDFGQTVEALARGRLGALGWTERRPLSEGAGAFADIDAGRVGAAKIILET